MRKSKSVPKFGILKSQTKENAGATRERGLSLLFEDVQGDETVIIGTTLFTIVMAVLLIAAAGFYQYNPATVGPWLAEILGQVGTIAKGAFGLGLVVGRTIAWGIFVVSGICAVITLIAYLAIFSKPKGNMWVGDWRIFSTDNPTWLEENEVKEENGIPSLDTVLCFSALFFGIHFFYGPRPCFVSVMLVAAVLVKRFLSLED